MWVELRWFDGLQWGEEWVKRYSKRWAYLTEEYGAEEVESPND